MNSREYGYFVAICAHTDGDCFGLADGADCDKPAIHHKYGMARCDKHVGDLDPANWPDNKGETHAWLSDRGRNEMPRISR